MVKDKKKTILAVLCAGLILAAAFVGGWMYLVYYMPTLIFVSESEDGAYRLTVRRIGEPEANIYNAARLQVRVERKDKTAIAIKDFLTFEDEASFRSEDCQANWYPAGVEVRFGQPVWKYLPEYSSSFSEKLEDLLYIPGWKKPLAWLDPLPKPEESTWAVAFDGSDGSACYTPEQALKLMRERYGAGVSLLRQEQSGFVFSAGGVEFHGVNDVALTEDFLAIYSERWARDFSAAHNRMTVLKQAEEPEEGYVPFLLFSGRYSGETESFTRAACDLIENYIADPYLSPEGKMPAGLGYSVYEEELMLPLGSWQGEYDRSKLYSQIYAHVEENSLRIYESVAQAQEEKPPQGAQSQEAESSMLFQGVELTDEIWELYLSIDPTCTYVRADGTQLHLIEIDRALGSSFYILIALSEDGSDHEIVTWNPHLGHGGQAMWLNFTEDDRIGFSCLAYSGGTYGMLFRTEDGGKTYTECTYPSANAELPNGELYNPFVMPEKVFVEESLYYLLAGQGPDGDYYGEEGYCKGLYRSSDKGKTWIYVGEVPGVDIYLPELYED